MAKKKLFGNSITPSCEYCRNVIKSANGELICQNGMQSLEKVCKKYIYDPLKREPKATPNLPRYNAEDFKI